MLLGSLAGADGVESTVRAFVTKSNPNARDSLLVTGYTQVPQERGSSRPSRPSRPCAYGLISYGPTLMPTHAHTHKHTQWQGALRDEAGVYGWFTDAIHTYLGSQVCMWLAYVYTPRLAAALMCMWLRSSCVCGCGRRHAHLSITYLASQVLHQAPAGRGGVCTRSLARAADVGLELCALACSLPLSRFSLPLSLSPSQ